MVDATKQLATRLACDQKLVEDGVIDGETVTMDAPFIKA